MLSDSLDSEIPRELIEAFRAKPSRVVLVVGSGISRRARRQDGSCFPTWVELLREAFRWTTHQGFRFTPEQISAFDSLLARGDSKSLIHAAGWLKTSIGNRLLSEFMLAALDFVPRAVSPIHQLLARLPVRGVVTTNYDCLLETAFSAPPPAVITPEDNVKLSRLQGGGSGFFVFKAHGDIGRPDTLVFSHDDYRRLIVQNNAYRTALSTIFEQHVIFMVGFGLEDPDIEYLFDEILATFSAPPLKVYALVPKGRVNTIFRDIWLRERRLRLIEYEPRSDDHTEIDGFLEDLIQHISQTASTIPTKFQSESDGKNIPQFVSGIRKRLVAAWNKIASRLAESQDCYSLAHERAQVVDEIVKEILEECARTLPLPAEGFAVIARGGYGMGHLSSSSDIDITLLHAEERTKEVEAIITLFLLYLRDCIGPVGLRALPIINTIEECRGHWFQDADSLISFTFSRLIVGDLNLHIRLREAWRDHVRAVPLSPVVAEIKRKRLFRNIEEDQPDFLNVKTCAGGLLEIMAIHFVDEVLRLKGKKGPEQEEAAVDLDGCFGRMLYLRELAFRTTKTIVLAKSSTTTNSILNNSGEIDVQHWREISKCRRAVRQRLLNSLMELVP